MGSDDEDEQRSLSTCATNLSLCSFVIVKVLKLSRGGLVTLPATALF